MGSVLPGSAHTQNNFWSLPTIKRWSTHRPKRLAMLMFVVSEVHPFDDGNGRLARIMANAELVRGGLCRLLITTSYRQDYLRALRRLSRQRDPGLYLRMLDRAQAFTAGMRPDSYSVLKEQLTTAKAFDEANEEMVWKPIQGD